jgi:hypothetical protein
MCKFLKEKLEDCLDIMRSLMRRDLGLDAMGQVAGTGASTTGGRGASPELINLEDEAYLKKVREGVREVSPVPARVRLWVVTWTHAWTVRRL